MTMFVALHLNSDVDRFYIKRKAGGRGLMSVKRCIREEENSFSFYVNNSEKKPHEGIC